MSGALGLALSLTSWRAQLRPASFRGVPFEVDAAEGVGGRRIVVHEFPERDDVYTEDLGRNAQHRTIEAFVIGDDYMDQRDALISACQDYPTAALLVHPTLGELTCRAGRLRWKESKELGGLCALSIEFIIAGEQPSPLATADTAAAVLNGARSLLATIIAAYQLASLVATLPAFVAGQVAALLGTAAADMAAAPPATIAGLTATIAAVSAAPTDDAATAAAVQTALSAMADNVLAAAQVPAQPDDPLLGTPPALVAAADVSGGLVALASWGSDLPAVTGTSAQATAQAAQQAAVTALVQGSALASLAALYAQLDWPYAQAADDARAALLVLLDAQAEAAADAGQIDAYRAWLAFSGVVMADMIARAQNLPQLLTWRLPGSLPAVVLAQRWYQDPSRAEELVALNGLQHPLFAGSDGVRLSQ